MKLRDYYREAAPLFATFFVPLTALAALVTGNWAYLWFTLPGVLLLVPFALWLIDKGLGCD